MERTSFLLSMLLTVVITVPARAQAVTAGAEEFTGAGVPDGGTNILYINESVPFDFGGAGDDHGVLTNFRFWVAEGRATQGVVTPFVAEPLTPDGVTGDDFVIRAIGTTREAVTDWECGGLYQYPFHDTEQFTVQDGWLVGFLSSDTLGERPDALSPIPFFGSVTDGWLSYSASPGNAAPAIDLGEPILEGVTATDVDAFGFREYQFQIDAAPGDTQPPLDPGGKLDGACPGPAPGNIAGTNPVAIDGTPDSWTNILYINEEQPFSFSEFGTDRGVLDEVSFAVAAGEEFTGMVTPFVAEPLVDNPQTGEDFIIRAIGTTREGDVDWEEPGVHSFAFSDTETFEVETGWVAGFLSSDPLGESDLAQSPIPFIGEAGVNGWLTGSSTVLSGAPAIELNESILEGISGTNVDAYGFRRYQFQITASVGPTGEPGDFNGDAVIDAADMDLLTGEVLGGTNAAAFDLTGDGQVNDEDRTFWVENIKNTYFGDSNLDGEFNSGDLVSVLSLGKYEDAFEDNAGWADGDWDGDLDFTTTDFVVALSSGGYENGPRAAVNAVPEPTSVVLLALGMLIGVGRRRTA
jgi:hypothetical protein